MLRAIRVPATNERGPLYMEHVAAALHHANPKRLPISLGFTRFAGEVTLFAAFPPDLRGTVEGQIYAHYPEANATDLPEDALACPEGMTVWEAAVHVHRDVFPLRRYAQFEDPQNRVSADPITALLTPLAAPVDEPIRASLSITIRPARRRRVRRAEKILRMLARPFFRHHPRLAHLYLSLANARRFPVRLVSSVLSTIGRRSGPAEFRALDTSTSRLHEREEDLQGASEKIGKLLFEADVHLQVIGPASAESAARQKLREMAGTLGQFSAPRLASFQLGRVRRGRRRRPRHRATFLLSTEEVATLWHPPTQTVRAPTMRVVESREAESPVQLPLRRQHPDLTVFGVTAFRGSQHRFGILPDDRRRHIVIEGKTGMGKSTLLQNLLVSDIAAGQGVGLLDPHGDLCDAVLARVPRHRTNDVILFDAGDTTHPIAFNILHCPDPRLRPLLVSGVLSSFKKLYREFWGPRMEHILRNALLAVLDEDTPSLLSVLRMVSDRRYREQVLTHVRDPVVRSFWQQEFVQWPARLQAEAVAPVQNKLGHFVSSPLLRNILGQTRSTLDLLRVMDESGILLVNLSKGRLGEDVSALLGSFLVTALQIAAMRRADTAEVDRRDFYLSIDEFQNFATESFGTILSEARKYRLNLTMANQYLAQMDDLTRSAIFGNVGTLVVFQVGAEDAELLTEQLGGDLVPRDLLSLPRFQAYVRLLIDGQPSRPFSMRTLPPRPTRDRERGSIIRRQSQRRYTRPAAEVEKEIAAALQS